MCGIAGIFSIVGNDYIERMVNSISHRGPDNAAYESIGDMHLGHTRLSIIDLSTASNQPLWDVKRIACIVFNGEIYNFKVLRQELIELGYEFSSLGDAEVIINLYLQYGVSCLEKLSGIFAFAIWDTRSAELFVVRDGFGVKPLYYTENSDGFYFASEIKSLLTVPSIPRALNYDAVLRTVVFLWSPGPETILKSVLKLEPGSYLIVKDYKIVKHVQYSVWPEYQPEKMTIEQASSQIQNALQSSIKDQLVADVPLGAFLSGGLDSSLIVAMAKQTGVESLECFTIDSMSQEDKSDGFVDDLPYAKKVADYLRVNLNIVEAKSDIIKLLPKVIYHLDEPLADPAPLNVLLISELARKKGIKVLFSGAGGDDVFTGYRRHYAILLEKYYAFLPWIVRWSLQRVARKLPKKSSYLRRISKMFSYASCTKNERLLSYFYWIDPLVGHSLFTDEVQKKLSKNPMASMMANIDSRPETNQLEKMLYLERRYFLVDHNFNYTDKMSMACGVEVRVPFLDKRVVEVASRMDVSLKQRGATGKWILKKMAERYLPKAIIYRSKSGFGAPLRRWLKTDLKLMVDDLLSDASLNRRGIFKASAVRKLIEQDRCGQEDYSYPIFSLLCIELWCRIFIDGKKPNLL
jgi:asparagine synthase (glutamine-hydrolysing)